MSDAEPRYWNYRVRVRSYVSDVPGIEPEEQFDIIEVYYHEDDSIWAYGEAVLPMGDTKKGLRKDLTAMLKALDKPALEEKDLPVLT